MDCCIRRTADDRECDVWIVASGILADDRECDVWIVASDMCIAANRDCDVCEERV